MLSFSGIEFQWYPTPHFYSCITRMRGGASRNIVSYLNYQTTISIHTNKYIFSTNEENYSSLREWNLSSGGCYDPNNAELFRINNETPYLLSHNPKWTLPTVWAFLSSFLSYSLLLHTYTHKLLKHKWHSRMYSFMKATVS